MSQTTLNLVAITIFSLVISTLLGPLLHIPEYVPAIAAISILGIATLDTLSWQGQAGTLLLDWLASFSPEHRARVIRHEAGHFLVAHLLEIPVTAYTLSAWEAFRKGQPGQGGVSFGSEELDTALEQGIISAQLLDRFCTALMAGAIAESIVYGDVQGGADDRQKFRTLWAQMRRPDAEGEMKERWFKLQAKTLLETNWAAYEALVIAMEMGLSVEGCCQVIDHHQIEVAL
ncbi:MAG: ATP-dependent Zn protease [Leptolyngbyaceae cyanobacterium CRU_2_3]|nr:ATP-dependent Zn protease [Leptolyngbyaceae cyanobacterium CRU_2_3]